MVILANIWDKWVSKEGIINAARKVGITSTKLSVEMMQQDKFERAAAVVDTNDDDANSSAISTSSTLSIVSPDKRRGSSQYWQDKFNQAMGIIDELHEKSIVLKEIPGFLPVQKVKPKLSKKNTRITQVHGSM